MERIWLKLIACIKSPILIPVLMYQVLFFMFPLTSIVITITIIIIYDFDFDFDFSIVYKYPLAIVLY